VPQGAGHVAALFAGLQDEVRKALPEAHRRRAFLRTALSGPAAQAAMRGEQGEAIRLLREALARDQPDAGAVSYIDARGPVDSLTLRAARALSAADVLVCDAGADEEVLALARRDAERTGPQTPARLGELTSQGLRVARLITGTSWRTELAALTEAGVETEVLPIAS
jgi:hypothetical protein